MCKGVSLGMPAAVPMANLHSMDKGLETSSVMISSIYAQSKSEESGMNAFVQDNVKKGFSVLA